MGRSQNFDDERRCARVALKPIENIVVGTSLNEASDVVESAAVDVTNAVGGRLTFVHSIAAEALIPNSSTDWHESDLPAKWLDLQEKELATRVARLNGAVAPTSRLESGPAYRVILETAAELGADLIVIGASDRSRFARFLGGTADRVLRRAQCPVLVVRGPWRFPIGRVLMPVDFSQLSEEAFDCGLCFLSQLGLSTARLELFFTAAEQQRALSEPFAAKQFERLVLNELERFGRESPESNSLDLSYRAAVGSPSREILKEADRFDAHLVVVGTHGQSGIDRALIGSVAKAVATEAACPVLFIPPEVALGASIAEAVLEQTAPRWSGEDRVDTSASEGGSS